MKLNGLSHEIFMSRYAYPGDKNWRDRAKVIAFEGASAEMDDKKELWEKKFFDILKDGDFMPGGRIIYGSGRKRQNKLNCYFLRPQDSVKSIGKFIDDVYTISCGGGGVGQDYSLIRPEGDSVGTNPYAAPGAISNMRMVNAIGTHVELGGGRRVAFIALLAVTHPEILKFLTVKLDHKELTNFNISVITNSRFHEAVEKDEDWYFTFNNRRYYVYDIYGQDKDGNEIHIEQYGFDEEDALGRANARKKINFEDVYNKAVEKQIKARDIWDRIYSNSVESGDPGIFNGSLVNSYTNVHYFQPSLGSNPCSEINIPHAGSCCLGNINLNNFILSDGTPDWKKLARTIRSAIRFLDNTLTTNHYPLPENREEAEDSRRIGLGVTGLHYFLIKLGHRYGDEKCCEFVERLFQTIRDEAYKASVSIAKEKGSFRKFDAKLYLKEEFAKTLPPRIRTDIKKYGIRNAVMLTCPPCGTISMVLGVSTGIEPIFSPVYERKYRSGNVKKTQLVADPLFKEYFTAGRDVTHFVGAYDVTPEEHIKMQASIQKFIDGSISKTLNLPEEAKYEDVKDIIFDYAPYVKGFTIYRAGSKGEEPLKAVSTQGLTRDEISAMLEESVSYGSEQEPEEEQITMCDLTGKGCE